MGQLFSYETLGSSPWMPFLLVLHKALALLVRIPVVPVNIKPYLKGPGLRWVQEVCSDWPTAFAKLPFEGMFFCSSGSWRTWMCFFFFLFFCRSCSNVFHPPLPPSVFSPLMSLFVASNTFQLAQWCIAPNILTGLPGFTAASVYCLFLNLFLSCWNQTKSYFQCSQ